MILLVFFFVGSSSTHMDGLNPAGLTESIAQANDPVGQIRGTHKFSHICMPSYYSSDL